MKTKLSKQQWEPTTGQLQKSSEGATQVWVPEPGAAEEVSGHSTGACQNHRQLPDLTSAVLLKRGAVSRICYQNSLPIFGCV